MEKENATVLHEHLAAGEPDVGARRRTAAVIVLDHGPVATRIDRVGDRKSGISVSAGADRSDKHRRRRVKGGKCPFIAQTNSPNNEKVRSAPKAWLGVDVSRGCRTDETQHYGDRRKGAAERTNDGEHDRARDISVSSKISFRVRSIENVM